MNQLLGQYAGQISIVIYY